MTKVKRNSNKARNRRNKTRARIRALRKRNFDASKHYRLLTPEEINAKKEIFLEALAKDPNSTIEERLGILDFFQDLEGKAYTLK